MMSVVLLLVGCDADCDDPARINGTYAAFHAMFNATGEGSDGVTGDTGDTGDTDTTAKAGPAVVEGYDDLSYALFANGWSQWALTWAESTGSLKVAAADARERMGDPALVDGQTFTWSGQLTQDGTNCNAFDLVMRGIYTTSSGTTHDFDYTSSLTWQGEALSGTFTYADTFSGAGGTSGSITAATGEVSLVGQPSGQFDTGF